MSQYKALDRAIIDRLGSDCDGVHGVYLMFVFSSTVRTECDRIASKTGRDVFRVLDGRIQALRKRRVIEYSRDGWRLTNGTDEGVQS